MKENVTSAKPTVLIAPLNWGLGHATRCIPLIHAFLKANCKVIIAGEKTTLSLLQLEFPHLPTLSLSGSSIQYPTKKWLFPFYLLAQVPSLLGSIRKEQAWLKKVVAHHQIDAVISDNRYGLYHQSIPAVFITHQLRLKSFMGNWADDFLQQLNYKYINRFAECWVPDAGQNGLAGELSHPLSPPKIPLHYLGWLSRFGDKNLNAETRHLLVIISGPEPQRTIFENIILQQAHQYKKQIVLVRGLPNELTSLTVPANIEVHNHLPGLQLKEKIEEASFVISRCGYSTVMDVAALQKKAIFIPTPGQTEQEYLGQHLMNSNFALCIAQNKFQLSAALSLAASFNYSFQNWQTGNSLRDVVERFVNVLRSKKNSPEYQQPERQA